MRALLFWVTRSRWLIFAIVIGIILFALPTPDGLSSEAHHLIVIIIITLLLVITEPIPLPATALFIIVSLTYFGIDKPNEIAHAFMNDAVFFIMGSLMLAVAIVKQGWDARIALGIIKLTGNKTRNVVMGFTVISALLSSFIGGHTVAALMLPIGMTLVRYTSRDVEKSRGLAAILLFSIAYGALVGSIGTPSGAGRNVIMLNYLNESGIGNISYAHWMLYIYPLVIILAPLVAFILMTSFSTNYDVLDSGIRKLKVQVARAGAITFRELGGLFIFILVFLGWIFFSTRFGLGTIALTGVMLYIIFGLVKWDDINRNTHWGVIILFGATIVLGTYMRSTGAALWLANGLISLLANGAEPLGFLSDVVIITMSTAMANTLSGSATVAVLGPITLHMGDNLIHQGLLTVIASAFGFFTAVAAPVCAIIYSSGLVSAKDFFKAGWKVGLISMIILIIYANTYWRLWF
ncbi:MAG: DASS family sodium-coupled anion symporter [Candidatus Marinimicrobia bacterium]|nr:DASS family sodium-coupled anion symporter [Candidatus Neomarinimicrobiota bacterium]